MNKRSISKDMAKLLTLAKKIERKVSIIYNGTIFDDGCGALAKLHPVRRQQLREVKSWLDEPSHSNRDIYTIHYACKQVWKRIPHNYPNYNALYNFYYLHQNEIV